jgi:hypothetical protein
MGVHDASRAAANKLPSERTTADLAAMNMGDQATRNADFAAREREKVFGPTKS